jgi:hypothetical protein
LRLPSQEHKVYFHFSFTSPSGLLMLPSNSFQIPCGFLDTVPSTAIVWLFQPVVFFKFVVFFPRLKAIDLCTLIVLCWVAKFSLAPVQFFIWFSHLFLVNNHIVCKLGQPLSSFFHFLSWCFWSSMTGLANTPVKYSGVVLPMLGAYFSSPLTFRLSLLYFIKLILSFHFILLSCSS